MLPSRSAPLRLARTLRVKRITTSRNLSLLTQRPVVSARIAQYPRSSHLQEQRRHLSFDLSSLWSSSQQTPGGASREGLATTQLPASTATPSVTQATTTSADTANATVASSTPPHLNPSHAEHVLALPRDVDPSPVNEMNLSAISSHNEHILEQVGYLHQLGIDYGWGPTSLIQWLLENIHFTIGLPWWASLIGTAAIIRLSMFPLNMRVSDMSARLNHIRPMITPLTEKMTAAIKAQDVVTAAAARHEMTALQSRAGIAYAPTIAGLVLNGVFGFCGFRLMNSLAALPVPSMMTGGAAWFTDLTISDPYYLLPGLMGFALHLTFRFAGGDGGVNTMEQYKDKPGVQKFMQYGLPGLVSFSMMWFSAGTNLYIATNTLIGLTTGRLLLNKAFRARFGLTPNPERNASGNVSNPMFGAVSDFAARSSGSAAETSQAGRVIDVQNVRAQSMKPEYQAPTARSASTTTSGSSGSSNASATSTTGLGDRIRQRSGATTAAADAGMLDRYINWGTDKINSLGSGYTKASSALGDIFSGGQKKKDEAAEKQRRGAQADQMERQRMSNTRRGRGATGRR